MVAGTNPNWLREFGSEGGALRRSRRITAVSSSPKLPVSMVLAIPIVLIPSSAMVPPMINVLELGGATGVARESVMVSARPGLMAKRSEHCLEGASDDGVDECLLVAGR